MLMRDAVGGNQVGARGLGQWAPALCWAFSAMVCPRPWAGVHKSQVCCCTACPV